MARNSMPRWTGVLLIAVVLATNPVLGQKKKKEKAGDLGGPLAKPAMTAAQAYGEAQQMLVGFAPGNADQVAAQCKEAGLKVVEIYGRGGFLVCQWPKDKKGAALAAEIRKGGFARYVVPNLRVTVGPPARPKKVPAGGAGAAAARPPAARRHSPPYGRCRVIPNDPFFHRLWGLESIRAPQAWCCYRWSKIPVAVVDTGVDYNHEDLSASMWRNPYEIPGDGLDNDGNGVVDDVFGYDAVNNDGDPIDDHGHGSHVAGTIGAVGNNGRGVVGVNWRARIMSVKVLNANGSGSLASLIKGIDYATQNGAWVMNASLGFRPLPKSFRPFFQPLRDAIARAEAKGVLFVAAAGNNYGNDNDQFPVWPAAFADPTDPDGPLSNMISVASLNVDENLSNFSNKGKRSVHIAAPGGEFNVVGGKISGVDDILSVNSATNAWPNTLLFLDNKKYVYLMGTSMATPHVSGAVTLVWGQHGYIHWSGRHIKGLILSNSRPLSSLKDMCATEGTLDLSFLCRRPSRHCYPYRCCSTPLYFYPFRRAHHHPLTIHYARRY